MLTATRRARDEGASAIELAIVAPALLLLIFVSIQVSLWLYARNVAQQGAREGVSYLRTVIDGATVESAMGASQINAENYVRAVARGAVHDPVAEAGLDDDGRVRLEVTGEAISLVPGLNLRVHGSARGEIEQFQVDD
jgi:Flp pilus assembly protein TadG